MNALQHLFSKKQADDPLEEFVRKSTHDDPDACKAIVAAGPAFVDQLIVLLRPAKAHAPNVRRNAARALGQIGDVRAVEPLVAAVREDDVIVRTEAATALGRLGDVRAVEPLIKALDDGYAVSAAAALALGQLGDVRAAGPLVAMLNGCYECSREAAAEALGNLRDPHAVTALLGVLHSDDATMRKVAAQSLTAIGWQPDSPEARAAHMVARQAWPECVAMGAGAVHQLIMALKSSDFEITWHAGNALVAIGAPAVVPLRACLSDRDPAFHSDVMRLLTEIDPRSAKDAVSGLNDPPA